MEKYFFAFKNSIQNNLVYRFNVFMTFFSEMVSFGALFYVWSSIYQQNGQIGDYTFRDIILYYFAVNFITLTVKGIDIAWQVGDEIRLGHITKILLWPISYSKYKFAQILGGYFFRGAIYLVIFSVIGFFLFKFFNFEFDLSRIFLFFISLAIGSVIYFLVFYAVGLSTFWFGLVRGFNFGTFMIVIFLEGSVIPLDFFPDFLAKINNLLPFKYIMYIPVSIFTGRIEWQINYWIVPIGWILFMYFAVKFIYKKGIKAYEGFGI